MNINDLVAKDDNLKKITLDFKNDIVTFIADSNDIIGTISSAVKNTGIEGDIGQGIIRAVNDDLKNIKASLNKLDNISEQLTVIADEYQVMIDLLMDSMS